MRKLMLLTALVGLFLLGGTYTAQAEKVKSCSHIKQAIVFYKKKTWAIQDKFNAPRTQESKRKIVGCAYARWVRDAWKWRAKTQRKKLEHRWQLWLPRRWYLIGSCETGYGGPPNWQHSNSSYQGAFGFAIRSWDDFKLPGYPDEAWQATPWQQYQVALAIYNRYGFTGWGCA